MGIADSTKDYGTDTNRYTHTGRERGEERREREGGRKESEKEGGREREAQTCGI